MAWVSLRWFLTRHNFTTRGWGRGAIPGLGLRLIQVQKITFNWVLHIKDVQLFPLIIKRMRWVHVKKYGICFGRSLRNTRNSITVLKREGAFKSIRITPTILIHISEWFFLLFAWFHCPTWVFSQPSACFSGVFYGSHAVPSAQCPSRN